MTRNTIPRPLAVALLNLNGLGLGYLYLKRRRRWLVHLLITVGWVALALRTSPSSSPGFWWIATGLWLLWMAVDGWRQAQRRCDEPVGWPQVPAGRPAAAEDAGDGAGVVSAGRP